MAADDAALVLVKPNDDIKTILTKVQGAGRPSVELLVPEGVGALQSPDRCVLLRRSAERDGIRLLLISSDEVTLAAARQGKIETVGVKDGHVVIPDTLPVANGERRPQTPPRVSAAAPPEPAPASISERDAEFLRSLDALPPATPPPPPAPAARESTGSSRDDAFMAELDDLSAAFDMGDEVGDGGRATAPPSKEKAATPYDAFAAELDDWSANIGGGDTSGAGATPAPARPTPDQAPTQPRRRVTAADIELSPEEKLRASKKPEFASRRSTPASSTPAPRERLQRDLGKKAATPNRSGFAQLIPLLMIGVIVLFLIIVLVLAWDRITSLLPFDLPFGRSAVVTVVLPPPLTEPVPIIAQPILRAQAGAAASDVAVQAEEIRTTVVYTATGEVATETLAPAGAARGGVTLYNESTTQTFAFPPGTEFIAVNAQGQEVTFASDAPVTLGTAVTSRTGAQIITTLGEVAVTVTARTPGSGSNVDANTISRIVVPGQGTIFPQPGGVLVEHGPLTGGDEQPIRVVKDTDVQAALGPALTVLNNRARQVLEAELAARQSGLLLEVTTITPNAENFANGSGYSQTVIPPIGQTVDPANPFFSLVVEGQFSALATPPNYSLQQQLQVVLPRQLESENRLPLGTIPAITDWNWDGSRLTVDGILRPSGEPVTLDAETRQRIRNAIRGKSRAEAMTALDSFVQQGIISSYSLPEDVQRLPNYMVEVRPLQSVQQQ